jgi:hypothetical protein
MTHSWDQACEYGNGNEEQRCPRANSVLRWEVARYRSGRTARSSGAGNMAEMAHSLRLRCTRGRGGTTGEDLQGMLRVTVAHSTSAMACRRSD